MEFSVKSGNPEKQRTACLVLGVYESRRLTPPAEQFDTAAEGFLGNVLRRGDLEGKPGQTLLLVNTPATLCDRVLLVGCGRERDLDDRRYKQIIAAAVHTLNDTGATEAVSYLTDLNVRGRDVAWKVRLAVEVSEDVLYRYDETRSRKDAPRRPLKRIVLAVPSRRELPLGEQAVREGAAVAEGMKLARDLGNLPPNICTPAYLAGEAHQLARDHAGVSCEVLEEEDMYKLGMGALLGVAQGSANKPRLIALEWKGGAADEKPYALVGKGVTFDTGGISIKPSAGMEEMKFDMCGAAGVLGAFLTAVELKLKLNLVCVVPAVENMPGSNAQRPSDVVTTMSGQTVEVLNTDAEGRLILCDALTWVQKYNPQTIIDVATLTGACVVALGKHASGLMTQDDTLADELLAAGQATLDRAWRLPLWDDYQSQLETGYADIANIGGKYAGAITAGCFLARFTEGFRWAHLDIAGSAWDEGRKGSATGRPVPLLVQYLLDRAGG